jgi:hypothetical protein
LDLSHNCFGEECGKILGAFISKKFFFTTLNIYLIFLGGNYSLESINLGWNNFRGRSAIDIINGIKVFISCSCPVKYDVLIVGEYFFETLQFRNEWFWTDCWTIFR